ncbi:Uncharacterized protein TCM_029822 [Theobroma cacao]|uniref:Uncharacterized protein n=1 Tax=Theobroma cacao TaxID=3641 RepID=A0A061GGD7_THECC|nr:Uncharacterized protein TCM_029822 [Theobroma cacao]
MGALCNGPVVAGIGLFLVIMPKRKTKSESQSSCVIIHDDDDANINLAHPCMMGHFHACQVKSAVTPWLPTDSLARRGPQRCEDAT